jgi:two-component system cell cycle response regulator
MAALPRSVRTVQHRSVKLPRANERMVLIVDDAQANLDFFVSLLEFSGYRTATARDAKTALRLALQVHPDLILSGVCMPEGSGYDLITEIKSDRRLSSIPFIFIASAAMDGRSRRRGFAVGGVNFLFRPIEPQQLLRQIENCLAERENP